MRCHSGAGAGDAEPSHAADDAADDVAAADDGVSDSERSQ
jgi:hypothetical protein